MSRLNIFFGHFLEFRSTLIKLLITYFIIFLAMMPFANEIYYFFSEPLLAELMVSNGTVISTKLTSTFIVPFKITAYCALLISLPFLFFITYLDLTFLTQWLLALVWQNPQLFFPDGQTTPFLL